MAKYRSRLPQLDGGLFLTDGGLETTLCFIEGIDLPQFAAFDVLREQSGRDWMKNYFRRYAKLARRDGYGFVLESPTWRASPDWAAKIGYSQDELDAVNRLSIAILEEVRDELETAGFPMVISGCVGPRGDGYDPGEAMTADEAEAFHGGQVRIFAESGADMVTGITMTNVPEATGLARAAVAAGMPVAISFTVETDGRLPAGQTLGEAIETVDAATGAAVAYYMVNCAHPTHFEATLAAGGAWLRRLGGMRANASRCSHAELDNATELDEGNPVELGSQYRAIVERLPQIRVLGGCCGTDHRHVDEIGKACRDLAARAPTVAAAE